MTYTEIMAAGLKCSLGCGHYGFREVGGKLYCLDCLSDPRNTTPEIQADRDLGVQASQAASAAKEAIQASHRIDRTHGGGFGPGGWKQAVCSCGWKGRAVGAYQDNQLTMIGNDQSEHSREVGREAESAYWRVYREAVAA